MQQRTAPTTITVSRILNQNSEKIPNIIADFTVSVLVQFIENSVVKVLLYRLIHIPEEEKSSDLVNLLLAKLTKDRIIGNVKKNLGRLISTTID